MKRWREKFNSKVSFVAVGVCRCWWSTNKKSRHGWSRNEVNQSSAIVVDHCIEKSLSFRVATFGFGAHSLLWSQVYDDHNDTSKTTTITIIQQKVYFLLSLCINTQTYMHTYTRMIHMLIELFMCVCVVFRFFGHWVKKEALNDNKTQAYLLTDFYCTKVYKCVL